MLLAGFVYFLFLFYSNFYLTYISKSRIFLTGKVSKSNSNSPLPEVPVPLSLTISQIPLKLSAERSKKYR